MLNWLNAQNQEQYLIPIWPTCRRMKFSLREILTKNNILDEAQYQELVNKLSFEISEAFHFAKESPFPDSIEAYNGEYAF